MTAPSPTDAGARSAHAVGRQAARSSAVGSMLEFYDFLTYTQAVALVFPAVFFPSENPALAIIASLGTFGVGYLARPVVTFVLGAMADRRGRRHTLILTMALMGSSTVALGVLPGNAQTGVLAPILLVACRLVQGFAVAGGTSGSSTLIMGQTQVGLRGRRTSVTLQGAQLGQIVSAMTFIPLAALLPSTAFES
ncbi:MFS transporter [Actinomyces radicidentis]|uniref:MFS transporter n=1 Tax=Actinomyces radicidentis TaxID=111015 RepID=UPI0026E04946|nr:MFS transporter [Actinomyces radicidentis]